MCDQYLRFYGRVVELPAEQTQAGLCKVSTVFSIICWLSTLTSSARSPWLSLGEASRLLGVTPATLRRWADHGDVAAFVTPGGHRRFPRTVIRLHYANISPNTEAVTLTYAPPSSDTDKL